MRPRFLILDVFTDRRFGGNPLAVLPDARGLDTAAMQRIAREFNFSETTFVLPPESGGHRRVRIFTPGSEVPFAGHPNLGTASALALLGEAGPLDEPVTLRFEELAGVVPVTVSRRADGLIDAELVAPSPLALGDPVDPALVAAAVGLSPADLALDRHPPRSASVGLAFLVAELASGEAMARAKVAPEAMAALVAATGIPYLHLHAAGDEGSSDQFRASAGHGWPARESSTPVLDSSKPSPDLRRTRRGLASPGWTCPDLPEGIDRRTRMFAPLDGVPEDPATGSANAALAALLAATDPAPELDLALTITQGVEMGRPSRLLARVRKRGGAVVETRIGGTSVLVADGVLVLD
jgi:trans-2,3-dihydro-3-hydroxyanthranilate isomerase